jgi:hypothetical protein
LIPEQVVREAIPEAVRREIFLAHAHDPGNWFRRPSFHLWTMAMRRVLLSRGFDVGDQLIPTVERALRLR